MNNNNLIELIEHKEKKLSYKIDNPNNEISNIIKNKKILEKTYMSKEAAIDMDDSKAFEKILDRMDQDRREQEQRLSKNIELMEQRMETRTRDSEERMEARFQQVMNSIESTNKKVDEAMQRMENKFDKLSEEVKENNKYIRNISITTIIGIGGMVVAIALAVLQLVPTLMQLMNK